MTAPSGDQALSAIPMPAFSRLAGNARRRHQDLTKKSSSPSNFRQSAPPKR